MTDYKINEEDCKRLTEFLGECWHEWTEGSYSKGKNGYGCLCNKCEIVMYSMHQDSNMTENRSFTTPGDQHAVFTKLVEVGKWGSFQTYSASVWSHTPETFYNVWLFENPERFCKLVADYLKEEV